MIALYLLEPWRLLLLVVPGLLLVLLYLSSKKRSTSAVSFSTLGMLEGLVESHGGGRAVHQLLLLWWHWCSACLALLAQQLME